MENPLNSKYAQQALLAIPGQLGRKESGLIPRGAIHYTSISLRFEN